MRRPVLGATLVAIVGLLVGCQSGADPARLGEPDSTGSSPPNILWIVAEDHSPDLGSYGDGYASTPNLDRLATEGARFTRSFATSPVGAPARSTIITGLYATTIGSHHMRSTAVPPAYVKAFPEWLRAAGYHTSNHAKTDYNFSPWLGTEPRRAVHDPPLGPWNDSGSEAHWRNREPGRAVLLGHQPGGDPRGAGAAPPTISLPSGRDRSPPTSGMTQPRQRSRRITRTPRSYGRTGLAITTW